MAGFESFAAWPFSSSFESEPVDFGTANPSQDRGHQPSQSQVEHGTWEAGGLASRFRAPRNRIYKGFRVQRAVLSFLRLHPEQGQRLPSKFPSLTLRSTPVSEALRGETMKTDRGLPNAW